MKSSGLEVPSRTEDEANPKLFLRKLTRTTRYDRADFLEPNVGAFGTNG
jgi:hypothetical protein